MVRIECAAEEYTSGKIELVLEANSERKEELTFELDITIGDKIKLMKIERDLQGDKDADFCLKEQNKIMRDILVRSYPDLEVGKIDNICMRHGNQLLLELYFVWEWRDRDSFKAQQEAKKKIISDLKQGKLQGNNTNNL